jgi:hypothetical protein
METHPIATLHERAAALSSARSSRELAMPRRRY